MWPETGSELEASEPIPSLRALQSGRNSYGKKSSKKMRFYGQDRSQRRIFHRPPLPGTSNVREIQIGRHPLRVCLPPLWSCPSGIYENHETHCSFFTAAGHQIDNVFGQLAYHGPVKRNSELSCLYNSSSVRELPQVSFNPGHANGIFTLSHRLPNNDPGFTK